MNAIEEKEFTQFLQDAVAQAKEGGYPPNFFVDLIERKGAFLTVKELIARSKPSDGFFRLYSMGRMDLTCESIVVETKWRRFFDDDLLEIAEKRLTGANHKWRRFSEGAQRSGSDSPSDLTAINSTQADDFHLPEGDTRERALRMTHQREGQTVFRDALLTAYEGRCCITGLTIEQALEAAHISAYRGDASNHLQNGLLLRADLHRLFDRLMLSVDPASLTVRLAPTLREHAEYGHLNGTPLNFGASSARPSGRALSAHWDAFNKAHP